MTNHAGPIVAQRDGLTAIDCRSCGFIHLDWLPGGAELAAYYQSDFWQTEKSGWRERHEAERDWLDMRHDDWLSLLAANTLGRTLLDVGCGWGHFLERANTQGWNGAGVEPSAEAAAYCAGNGVRVLAGDWSAVGGRFDAITAFWLIEHLPDPAAFLRWARRRLYSGGTLMLSVPQEWTAEVADASPLASVPNWWLHYTHLNYFTAASLGNLLGRCGFRVIDSLTSYPMAQWIELGEDYTADPEIGSRLHKAVRRIELGLTPEARLSIARLRARQAAGRDLVLICKPE